MAEPTTVNTGLIIPNTGDLPGTWGSAALNPDFVAIDGYFGGVQTISLSTNTTLTAPIGFTPTPSGGPTQAQNAVLKFTGALTSSVVVTLPLPGYYIVSNTTTGNFVTVLRAAGTGQIIAVDQGETQHVFCDGTNVVFCNLGRVGEITIWAGLAAMPGWVTNCTVPPYLLCDGSIYNFSTYPYLGKRLGSAFGGNGITTFGVPDHRGRVALPYDGTGARITTAGSGLSGTTIGAALDQQTVTLSASQIPSITSSVSVTASTANNYLVASPSTGFGLTLFSAQAGSQVFQAFSNGASVSGTTTIASSGSGTSNNTGGAAHNNVQPSQVTGISVIRAA